MERSIAMVHLNSTYLSFFSINNQHEYFEFRRFKFSRSRPFLYSLSPFFDRENKVNKVNLILSFNVH